MPLSLWRWAVSGQKKLRGSRAQRPKPIADSWLLFRKNGVGSRVPTEIGETALVPVFFRCFPAEKPSGPKER
jgi:hypothetical protein